MTVAELMEELQHLLDRGDVQRDSPVLVDVEEMERGSVTLMRDDTGHRVLARECARAVCMLDRVVLR